MKPRFTLDREQFKMASMFGIPKGMSSMKDLGVKVRSNIFRAKPVLKPNVKELGFSIKNINPTKILDGQ